MVKRYGVLCGAILLTVLAGVATPVQAADFQIGAKYWFADWRVKNFKVPIGGDTINISGQEVNFDPYSTSLGEAETTGLGLGGLNLGVSFNKWGFTATYFQGDYDLRMQGKGIQDSLPVQQSSGSFLTYSRDSNITLDTSTSRTDLDLAVFYRVVPNFSLFFGYKFITYSYDAQVFDGETRFSIGNTVIGGVTSDTVISSLDAQLHGLTFGFSGSQSLGKHLSVFGGASYLPYVKGAKDTEAFTGDTSGWAYNVEFGFLMPIPSIHFIPSLSYRIQEFGGFKDLQDTFHGVVLGTSFYF